MNNIDFFEVIGSIDEKYVINNYITLIESQKGHTLLSASLHN